jgi:hypothetical protein
LGLMEGLCQCLSKTSKISAIFWVGTLVKPDFEAVVVYADFFVVLAGDAGFFSVEDLEVAAGYDVVVDD